MKQRELPIVAEHPDFLLECVNGWTGYDEHEGCLLSSEYDDVADTLEGCVAQGWLVLGEITEPMDDWEPTHEGVCPECRKTWDGKPEEWKQPIEWAREWAAKCKRKSKRKRN